jgi:hypothetical protein
MLLGMYAGQITCLLRFTTLPSGRFWRAGLLNLHDKCIETQSLLSVLNLPSCPMPDIGSLTSHRKSPFQLPG